MGATEGSRDRSEGRVGAGRGLRWDRDPVHQPRQPAEDGLEYLTRKVPAIRFHDLRHCMGTVLAEAGVEQRLIQELLGHSGIRISERYTRPRRPALRRAALKATRLMGVEPSV
jgi:integrase